jgi:hypothetical protein
MDKSVTTEPDDPVRALREAAIDRFIWGDKPATICDAVQRSRAWFYQTLQRYRREGRAGLHSRSRAPHHVHNRIPPDIEAAVVRVRQTILLGEDAALRYADIGADALAYELRRAGLIPPSRATINRILRRHNLVQPRPRKNQRQKLPGDYPWPCVRSPNDLHLFDFVSRTIRGERRCYGYNLLDQARRWPFLRVETPKNVELVGQFLVSVWQEVGLPGALYIDNDLVWNGGGRGQRVLGRIVRLCLLVGVEVIFTPPDTPQANPIVESFNDLWNTNFWRRVTFRDLTHMQSEAPFFEHYCRHRRPLPEFEGRTADQIAPDFVPVCLSATFDQHLQPDHLPITAGRIHFIRFVSSTGTISVLNERWQLDKELWAGKTVRATVDTQTQQLYIYHQPKDSSTCCLIAQFDYPLDEEAVPLADEFRRNRPAFWPPVEQCSC